ncbi:MAG: hypothetical protein WC819_00175 [Parcubacteria group bacterium]
MKKVGILTISGIIAVIGMVYYQYLCSSIHNKLCVTTHYSATVFEPLLLAVISIFSVSIFTFFISDKIFKKWTTFTIVWFIFDAIFIVLAPTSSPYFYGGPDKESISIWMGSLFVIISFLMFIIVTIKERRKK